MRIAVVGAGASAVCLLDALASRWETHAAVTVFDPAPAPWRGRPYREDAPVVRLNAPPREMSVRDGDTGHFERWLAARGESAQPPDAADPWTGDRFAPRSLYGRYLEDTAADAMGALCSRGVAVELRQVAVTGLLRTTGQVVVRTDDGRLQPFDACVLAVGVGGPADNYGLSGLDGFVADPYPTRAALGQVDGDVAVIGSGLTAVDTVLALSASGHSGRISLVSRHGVLPGVRQRYRPSRLRHFTVERMRRSGEGLRLSDLVTLMRAELREGGHSVAAVERELAGLGAEDPASRLRRHLGMVDDEDLGLRVLQQAVPETGPDVWPRLSEADRLLILREHYRTLMSLCCPMPPASAAVLLAMMEAGRLEVLDSLSDIRPRKSGFSVRTGAGRRTVATVVNAAGAPSHRIPRAAAPLVSSLVRSGAAQRHPHGGLRIDPGTSRVLGETGPDPRLYLLGDLAAGTLFFTFGIPSLVDRARDIVASLGHEAAALRTVLATSSVTANR